MSVLSNDAPGYDRKKNFGRKLRRAKKEKERTIENRCVNWLLGRYPKAMALKLNTRFRNHWPDRAFFIPGGSLVLIEFKKPGENATPAQAKLHRELKSLGFPVHLSWGLDDFKKTIRELRF